MKTYCLLLALLLIITPVFAQTSSAADKLKESENGGRFYNTEEDIKNLKNELTRLKQEMLMYKSDVNMPKIRQEIRDMVTLPELTHEITLKNGTVVQGKLLQENLDEIQVQTLIGIITLKQNQITNIRETTERKASLEFDGALREMNFSDKKVYIGKVKNTGTDKALFIRIVFRLFDDTANMINTDSCFVLGVETELDGGIYSSSVLLPGQVGDFQCTVPTLGKNVSYYTTDIKFSHIK
jgi:hypothetical protein